MADLDGTERLGASTLTMPGGSTSTTRQRDVFYTAVGALASLVLALAIGVSPSMGVALPAGIIVLSVGLFAPAVLLLAWIAVGPMLSTWLDVNLGPLPTLTPDRAVLAVLLPISAWRWLRGTRTILPLGRLERLMAWFICFAAVSTVLSGGGRQKTLALVTKAQGGLGLDFIFLIIGYALPFLAFFLTKNLLYRERHLRWLLGTFVAVGVFVALTGILQFFLGVSIFTPTRMDVIHTDRATGTMTSGPEFGLVVGTPLLVAIVCFLRSRYALEKLLLAVAIPIMAVAIVVSKTRVIWVGIAIGLAVAAFYEPRFRRYVTVVGLVSALGLAAAWPIIARSEFIRFRVMDMEPIYFRVGTTATALNMFIHSPLVGYGFGRFTFDNEKWDYIAGGNVGSRYAYTAGVPHNEYLHILVLLGLFGFVPYVSILVLAWRTASRHYRQGVRDGPDARRDIALAFLAAFSLYLTAASASDALFFGPATLQVFTLLGALDGVRVRESGVH